jgi:membrane-bound lytic murein transglycosylase MltF
MKTLRSLTVMLLLAFGCGCPQNTPPAPPPPDTPAAPIAGSAAPTDAADAGVSSMLDLATEQYLQLHEPWNGDFDEIASGTRRFLRALVPYSRTMYFLDQAQQRGAAYEALRELEKELGAKTPKGTVPPKIVIIPTSRDRLLPALAEGLGDIAVGGLTITEGRARTVAFSVPTADELSEVVVTGPGVPAVASPDDLAGREIHVRKSSSYYESLEALAARLKAAGREPPRIVLADEMLETEDLLQLVDAGVIPATVADLHLAKFWRGVYERLVINEGATLRTGAHTAWAVRPGAPRLLEVVNRFVAGHREGTLFGNVLLKRYFGGEPLRNPTEKADAKRFRAIVDLLRRYADEYRFDWLLVAAQAYQESGLDNAKRSSAGAVGVMQIKPSTAKDMGIGDVQPVDRNIEAGVKYMRFMADRYFADDPMDELNRELFAIASYNAGPAKVARLRSEAAERGLDPNVWFRTVEIVAARRIGRETVDYVSNIYKYYVAYKALVAASEARERAGSGP